MRRSYHKIPNDQCTDIEGVINKRWNGSDCLTKRGFNLHKIAESVDRLS